MDGASRTAEQVALFRALESARGHDRIFHDPYALRFLTGRYRLAATLARVRPVGRRLEHYIDSRWPAGPRASAVARTRLIDDLVSGERARQVLLLGAGYDSRAYRLPSIASARVFEVDHPATQAAKRRLLGADPPPRRVTFVPVDLLVDDLGDALSTAGFATGVSTVTVWEGVTNYLTAEAVDSTLRRLAELTAPGSRIVFTYIDRAVLDGTGDFPGAGDWHAAVSRGGEPWTFGFDPAALPGYLAERGLRLTLDLSASDAADRYLRPLGRDEPTAAFYRIARAEVR